MSGIQPIGTWAPRERRYIVEWAEVRYPGYKKYFNVPMGAIPESLVKEVGFEMARRWYRRWRPYADCVVDLVDSAILAEAELIDPKRAIRDLNYYREILPETPDFPVKGVSRVDFYLVIPSMYKFIVPDAEKRNIKVDFFDPEWLMEYFEQLKKYTTPEGILRRMERKRRLGVL